MHRFIDEPLGAGNVFPEVLKYGFMNHNLPCSLCVSSIKVSSGDPNQNCIKLALLPNSNGILRATYE
jgi:hypothetical protein